MPNDLKKCFNFEKKFISTLLDPQNRPSTDRKICDERSLRIRSKLLNEISNDDYNPQNLKIIRNKLICLWSNSDVTQGEDEIFYKNRTKCIQYLIDSINEDIDKKEFMLQFANYDDILKREARRFEKHVTGRSLQPLPAISNSLEKGKFEKNESYSVNYVGLRRWNSYTPQLSFSVGGGHFVFLSENKGEKKEKGTVLIGIAIDPGFDFIRNFFRQGFTLTDIDIVLLTHGHPDHIRDFPAIVELLNENKKRITENKKIYAVMSRGCYGRLHDFIAKDPFKHFFYDTIITDINKENYEDKPIIFKYNDNKNNDENRVILIPPKANSPGQDIQLKIKCFKSFHDDHSPSDSYGYILEFSSNNNKDINKVTVGFTGDSKWMPKYAEKFAKAKCDVVCSHIGSIADPVKKDYLKKFDYVGKAEKQMRRKNHPYLFGEILFLQEWKEEFNKHNKKALILISEFGEEMKGQIRSDLIKRFNHPGFSSSGTGCWADLGRQVTKSTSCRWLNSIKSFLTDSECDESSMCKKSAKNIFTMPVDVGFRLSVPLTNRDNDLPGKVHCVVCDNFIVPEKIDYEVYSHEEAMFYLCETCKRSVSIDVKHSIYQKYHEKGRDIEKYDTKL